MRSFILPDEEYLNLCNNDEVDLDELMVQWEKAFQDCFGKKEMVYNVHLWVRQIDAVIIVWRENMCIS